MYRVRVSGRDELAYLGQTGRSLRGRVLALTRHTLAAKMPWNDPHTAAPSLWSYRDAEGMDFELSVASVDLPEADRRGLECELLWQYRLLRGGSPLCNFGRLHKHYKKSGNRSTGNRGGRLNKVNPGYAPSISPLELKGVPADRDWMGLNWAEITILTRAALQGVPDVEGVYKLLSAETEELLYVGETKNLHSRLLGQGRKHRAKMDFSFCKVPELKAKSQRLDIENDLIGAFYHMTKSSPRFQFGVLE